MRNDLLLNEDKNDKIIKRYILSNDKINLQFLPNVKSINIFVGANNSGKSWMMRYLMNESIYNCAEWKQIKNHISNFNSIIENDIELHQRSDMRSYSFTAPDIIVRRFNNLDLESISNNIEKNKGNFIKLAKFL